MDEQIILDKESFKALAVDTRVLILKTLNTRRHTQSELAATLNLSVPTVKEHLDALVKANLVQRNEEGRKWVYYSLTKKGKAVVNPEEKKFWIALAVLVLTAVGGASGFIRTKYASLYAPQFASVSSAAKEAAPALMATAPAADVARTAGEALPAAAAPTPLPWGWIILGGIFAIELGIVLYFWVRSRRQKKELARLG